MAAFAGPALAAIPTPSGINPATGVDWAKGDTYRLAFFTSGMHDAVSADIAVYNTWVQGLADASTAYDIGADDGVTWKVIGSTATVDARDNTSTNPTVETGCPILLLDGTTIVANDYADLWDGEIQNIIDLTEQGALSTWWPYTGTRLDGTATAGYHGPLGNTGRESSQGNSARTDQWVWRSETAQPKEDPMQMYALSDPLAIVRAGATNPSPADGSYVSPLQDLSWYVDPNTDVVWSDVYFGTDPNAVEFATTEIPLGVYQGRQIETTYDPNLIYDTTYFWRIDLVTSDETIVKGPVWYFTTFAGPYDCNKNGVPDEFDINDGTSQDCNGNGIPDECDIADETSQDINGNGIPDECEPDCNGNGIPDDWDISHGTSQDINGNGIPDECEPDCNGNGIPDDWDISQGTNQDCNGNDIPDECDIAADPNLDCNGNDIPDECDIADETSQDCNGNGIPDECDISTGTSADVNDDGVPDECQLEVVIEPVVVAIDPAGTSEIRPSLPASVTELADGQTYYVEIWASDTGVDLTGLAGVYVDVAFCTEMSAANINHGTIFTLFTYGNAQSGGVDELGGSTTSVVGITPEWVRVGWFELSVDQPVSSCTIALQPSTTGVATDVGLIPWGFVGLGSVTMIRDCNGNQVPDDQDISAGTSQDCNGNDIPDECDIADQTSQDCNGNDIPDECDISTGSSLDCNHNGIPDECELAGNDCNGNGIPDDCDISSGTSTDVNTNGIPDECEIDIRIEPVISVLDPSLTSEIRSALPDSVTAVVRSSTYYIEIWASDVGETNTGLTNVYLDLSYGDDTTPISLNHGTIFTSSPSGSIIAPSHLVDEFGGSAPSGGGGVDPNWVRIGWIEMTADVDTDHCSIELIPSSQGISALSRGLIPWAFVELGTQDVQILPPMRTYDLDDDNFIGVGDFGRFRGSWQKSVPPADLEDDFDCDCFVGVGDLSYFATGWQKYTDDPSIIYPPCADPTCPGAAPQFAVAAVSTSKSCSTCSTARSNSQSQTFEAAFEIRVLTTPSASDIKTILPSSVENILADQTYYLELWASDIGSINLGLIAAYVDLAFTPGAIDVLDIDHNDTFELFLDGTTLTDRIDELGGSYLSIDSGIAIQPDWARVATVRFRANRNCGRFTLLPSTTGVACYGGPKLSWQNISLSGLIYPHTYDLNCDGDINLLDYAKMAQNWHQTGSDLPGDFDQNNTINLLDLHLLNLHWLTNP